MRCLSLRSAAVTGGSGGTTSKYVRLTIIRGTKEEAEPVPLHPFTCALAIIYTNPSQLFLLVSHSAYHHSFCLERLCVAANDHRCWSCALLTGAMHCTTALALLLALAASSVTSLSSARTLYTIAGVDTRGALSKPTCHLTHMYITPFALANVSSILPVLSSQSMYKVTLQNLSSSS